MAGPPTREECQAAIAVIAETHPAGADLPSTHPDYFPLQCLEAFAATTRQRNSEWTAAHLCRMVTSCRAQTHGVSLDDLIHAATLGPYAADWQVMVRSAIASRHRRRTIAEDKSSRVKPPMPPAKGTGGGWAMRRRLAHAPSSMAAAPASRPASSSSPRRQPIVPPLPAVASTGADPQRPTTARSAATVASTQGSDPFRDGNGRRKLFLPTRQHPPWSRHAAGERDDFDDVTVDASGRTPAAVRTAATAANTEDYRAVDALLKQRGHLHVGTRTKLGRKSYGEGALVIEVNGHRGEVFHRFHRQRHLVPQTHPEMASIAPVRPPNTAMASDTPRLRRELKQLVERLNDFC